MTFEEIPDWEKELVFPKKEEGIEFAYILSDNNEVIECDESMLYKKLQEEDDDLKLIATPDNDSFYLPGTDFKSLQTLLETQKKYKVLNLKWLIGFLLLYFLLFLHNTLTSNHTFYINPSMQLFLFIIAIIILQTIHGLFHNRRINESNYHKNAMAIKFDFWLRHKKVSGIKTVISILILIFFFQFMKDISESIEIAGLVKNKTYSGQYWRLLTAFFLHLNFWHIIINSIALYIFGTRLIKISSFSFFLIVFLISGLSGSLFSLLFLSATSVGASGGILGLIGFMLVLGVKHNNIIPKEFITTLVFTIILVAAFGIIESHIIDNACHLGGFLGGALTGLILIRKRKNSIPYKENNLIKGLGYFSAAVLIYGFILIFYLFKV